MCQSASQARHRTIRIACRVGAVVASLLLSGCAGLPKELQQIGCLITGKVNRGQVAGSQMLDPPQKVSAEFDCPNRPQPWVLLQTHNVWPPQVCTKHELKETLVYVVCPARGQAGLSGKLTRRVLTGGNVIWTDVEANYELKPGRWGIDLYLPIPDTATPGTYEFEVSFESGSVRFRDSKGFEVVQQ